VKGARWWEHSQVWVVFARWCGEVTGGVEGGGWGRMPSGLCWGAQIWGVSHSSLRCRGEGVRGAGIGRGSRGNVWV